MNQSELFDKHLNTLHKGDSSGTVIEKYGVEEFLSQLRDQRTLTQDNQAVQ